MSRIRTIKPDFWASEQVMSCSLLARILFIGMFNFCDDNGIHPASFMRLKAQVLPGDNIDIAHIRSAIEELIKNNLLQEYIVDDKSYWIVPTWKMHQRIDRPTYKYPLPISYLKNCKDTSTSTQRVIDEQSTSSNKAITDDYTNNLRDVSDYSTTDRNGMDSNGKEVNISHLDSSSSPNNHFFTDVQDIFEYWQRVMNHPKAKLDKKRKRIIKAALDLKYSTVDLKLAIDGCFNSPYHMGKNDNKQIYDDINLIFRDAEHIERFINYSKNEQLTNGNMISTRSFMSGAI